MDVVPLSVGRASRSWDQQHVEVGAASRQVGAAPTGGFTGAVSGAAARFATAWERHTTALADAAETKADTLRAVIADYVATDRAAAADLFLLAGYVGERR